MPVSTPLPRASITAPIHAGLPSTVTLPKNSAGASGASVALIKLSLQVAAAPYSFDASRHMVYEPGVIYR